MALRSAPLALVLDDYHVITTPTIHHGITELLDYAPAQLRLVLISRERPPLPLDRLRVRGRLLEVRAVDLRFTEPEASELLAEFLGAQLDPTAVDALVARTEGWGAGLILAALSSHDQPLPAAQPAVFSGATPLLLDYVAAEVLARQSPELRDFLLRTAVLDRLNAPLCAALLDPPGDTAWSRRMLDQVERRGLFLIPLDPDRHWFRYHQLFADVLRTQLARESPLLAVQLRSRAAHWLAAHQLPDEAMSYALAAADWPLAADLLATLGRDMLIRGEIVTLRSWLEALPESLRRRPHLAMLGGWLLVLAGDLAGAETLALSEPLDALAAERRTMSAIIAVLRGRLPDPEQLAALHGEAWSDVPFLRAIAAVGRGLHIQLAGDARAAEATYREAIRIAHAGANLLIEFIALVQLGEVLILRGQLRAAERIYQQAHELAARVGAPDQHMVEIARVGLGMIAAERGDLAAAEHLIGPVAQQRTLLGDTAGLEALLALAEIALAHEQLDRVEVHLAAAAQLAEQSHATVFCCSLDVLQAELALQRGNRRAAVAWLHESRESSGLGLIDEVVDLGRARILLAIGRYDEALALLNRLAPLAEAGGRGRSLLETMVLRALALRGLGRQAEARQLVAAARTLGEPEGYTRLLAALDEWPAEPSGDDALTIRELEVLRLIAAGLDNAAIAAQLVVAPSTVKKHINRIFAKLDAASRTQALVRAGELGLLR
ncbi:MAG: tetratricopeptide repeat protein [Oscillochloris sp.]|nr:tetratricopeptide repeat protein [Oscillochloris sp.]